MGGNFLISTNSVSIHASAQEATGALHLVVIDVLVVSIHASAQEATIATPETSRRRRVSIHASAQEATAQSRRFLRQRRVSIHASAQEATRRILALPLTSQGFNPRLRAGGDGCPGDGRRAYATFQSTPPRRRRRRSRRRRGRPRIGFNPRLRAGGDAQDGRAAGPEEVSIHASAQEATKD